MIERRILRNEKINTVEQILKTQERSDAFVERIFVGDHWLENGFAANCDGLSGSLQIMWCDWAFT